MRAIIDRCEDGVFVLELEDESFVTVPTETAPENAREGAVVEYADGAILEVDETATAERAEWLRSRFARLQNRT